MTSEKNKHPSWSAHTLGNLKSTCTSCTQCHLREGVRGVVFGVGPSNPTYMLIAEAPGANEDLDGEPFTGKAGKLLMQLIGETLGATRDEVYLANALKCRPPENRDPLQEEFEQCNPWLQRQIYHVRPRVIVAVGKYGLMAVRGQWDPNLRIGQERGNVGILKYPDYNVPYIACYHPAYALRNPAATDTIKEDLLVARTLVNSGDATVGPEITMW